MNAASIRATLRIARRNAGRSRWRSLLVSLLVLLPVAAMVGAITLIGTTQPSAERIATGQMGAADLIVYPASSAATEAAIQGALPAGTRLERFSGEEAGLDLPGQVTSVTLRSIDLDGIGRGMLTVIDGRTPHQADEAAVTRSVAQLAGTQVGGSITLDRLGSRHVVGILEDPLNLAARVVLQAPAAAAALPPDQVFWLAAMPPGKTIEPLLSDSGTGEPLFFVTSRADLMQRSEGQGPVLIVLGGLALVEAALVAAAAFGVSVRRRQRELGLLAASGAEPLHLAATVLAEGLVLGGLGAAAGVLVGFAAALAISPWLDGLTNHRNPPIGIDPGWALAAAAIGLLAALLAATVPAWTAARVPVLTALSGRRPPAAPARRTLWLGFALIAVAVILETAGAANAREGTSVGLPLLLGGAVLGTLGFGACSPWLLERFGRPAARLPLSARIAFRDTARARSRSGPIVTALLASFAATVALSAYIASHDAVTAAHWQPSLLPDQIYLQGQGVEIAGPQAARELGAVAAANIPYVGDPEQVVLVTPTGVADRSLEAGIVTIGSPDLVRALGAEAALGDFEDGSVILLTKKPADVTSVTVQLELLQTTDNSVVASVNVPARVVVVATNEVGLPDTVLPPQIGARLGLQTRKSDKYLIRLGHQVSDNDLSRAAAIVAQSPNAFADAAVPPTSGAAGLRTGVLLASLLFALAVTGIAVALGEAESRTEQRTLLALGAEPRLRRKIAAARAGVLTVLGTSLAVPAGLIPAWGLLVSRGDPLVVPLPELVTALVVLPLLAIVGTFLLTRPIPDWSALRSATA